VPNPIVLNVNPIVLNITAAPGAGNLLGNLLCDVAGLLNNAGGLNAAVANLLNNLLSTLKTLWRYKPGCSASRLFFCLGHGRAGNSIFFGMPKPMPAGTRAEVEQRVAFEHTLQKFHPELPPVLSTPQMIGWMEWACFLAAEPFCEGDETTVGTAIHVEHLAATGIGQLVKAEAEFERFDGKFYIFRVSAADDHQLIGRGTVHRAFVSVSRFMKRVEGKAAQK